MVEGMQQYKHGVSNIQEGLVDGMAILGAKTIIAVTEMFCKRIDFKPEATDWLLWYVTKFHDVVAMMENKWFLKLQEDLEDYHISSSVTVDILKVFPEWYWTFTKRKKP